MSFMKDQLFRTDEEVERENKFKAREEQLWHINQSIGILSDLCDSDLLALYLRRIYDNCDRLIVRKLEEDNLVAEQKEAENLRLYEMNRV